VASYTESLSGTNLATAINASDNVIVVDDVSRLFLGARLFVDHELMEVERIGPGKAVTVRRGVDGTIASAHAAVVLMLGRGDQFYMADPVGRPPDAPLVFPYVNALTGDLWMSEGDQEGTGYRYWQKVTFNVVAGALGWQQMVVTPSS
jgi:hypothetical protein